MNVGWHVSDQSFKKNYYLNTMRNLFVFVNGIRVFNIFDTDDLKILIVDLYHKLFTTLYVNYSFNVNIYIKCKVKPYYDEKFYSEYLLINFDLKRHNGIELYKLLLFIIHNILGKANVHWTDVIYLRAECELIYK